MLRLLGRPYAANILEQISFHEMRFNELKRANEGINSKTLSSILFELVDRKLVDRQVFGEKRPVLINYVITLKGKQINNLIKEIRQA